MATLKYRTIGQRQIEQLIMLDAARIDGLDPLTAEDLPNKGFGIQGLFEKGYVTGNDDDGYRITEAGTHALIEGEGLPKNGNAHPTNTPPVTNSSGHSRAGAALLPSVEPEARPPERLSTQHSVLPCTDCPHKRVLEIVAARIPEVRSLLDAVECFVNSVPEGYKPASRAEFKAVTK